MAFTSDGKRNYKCKQCGKWTVEDLKQWNSKPQAKKNICPACVEKAKLKWEVEVGMNFFKERNCPVCKKRIESNFWNFCPNCGAKIDGGLSDG